MEENILSMLLEVVSQELKKEEFKQTVLKPLIKSMVSYIMPYLFFIVAMNLFLALLAFIVVMYFVRKR